MAQFIQNHSRMEITSLADYLAPDTDIKLDFMDNNYCVLKLYSGIFVYGSLYINTFH